MDDEIQTCGPIKAWLSTLDHAGKAWIRVEEPDYGWYAQPAVMLRKLRRYPICCRVDFKMLYWKRWSS